MKTMMGRAVLGMALLGAGICAAQASSSGNLLAGGDAEAALCTNDWKAVTGVPGWTVVKGSPVSVCYTIGSFATPVSPARGNAFIADGPYGDSALTQTVDVAAAAAAIDQGTVNYTLSAWLGGWGAYAGRGVVSLDFLDASGRAIGATTALPSVTAADRGNNSGLVARSMTHAVPAGTRAIKVLLQFVDTSASYNIGYADNLSLTLSTPLPAAVLAPPVSRVPAYDHVFLVMMENTDYAALAGNTADAPFINSLATMGTLLAHSSGTYHPSDENYLAIAGGDNFVQGAIYFPNIHLAAPHLGDRLEAIGRTWKGYEQGMGTPCNLTNSHDSYFMPDDVPFIHFDNVRNDTARCQAHLVDITQMATDLHAAATTPNFSWFAADDYYDGEAAGNGTPASIRVQDAWLKQTIQPIFDSPAWKTRRSLLILTWDESLTAGNNQIATVLVDSQNLVNRGYVSQAYYNHYSVGRTIEEALGIAPFTPNDRYATPINDAFTPVTVPTQPSLSAASASSVPAGSAISFHYSTLTTKFSAKNWIGLYPAGVSPGKQASLSWKYAPEMNASLDFSTSGLAPGQYAAWYCYNDGYTVLAGPVPFTVTSP